MKDCIMRSQWPNERGQHDTTMTKGKNGQRGNTKKCYKKTTQWLKEKTNNGERNTT
jgi:hypothetical protein